MDDNAIRTVVGLGNPGRQYQRTRHNLGFLLVEALVARWQAGEPRQAFHSWLWEARPGGRRVLLAAPQTFMNRSGLAVAELTRFYKLPPSQVMVALDDLALPPGKIRLRPGGSAGGHNGLADVIRALGTDQVPRLRMGIGAVPGPMQGVDYVLGKLTEDELAAARQAIDQACLAVEDWLENGLEPAMSRHNA